jgi:23S rRNA pseudouridine1911/1915/1917 synthase
MFPLPLLGDGNFYRLSTLTMVDIKMLEKQVLFEDNHLLGVNKLSSQIVQGDKTGDVPLSELYKEFLKEKYQKPGNVFCGVIHRLDRPVSGVVLFAKTSKALTRMNEQFRERNIQKIYWAVVRGNPGEAKGTLVHYLKKNEKDNRSFTVKENTTGGLRCELGYEVLDQGDRYTLIEVKPLTGRHHQIRVQLSSIGCPIVGDVKYGDKRSNDDKSICLHARQLIFDHPVQKQETIITAPPPDQKYWNIFKT